MLFAAFITALIIAIVIAERHDGGPIHVIGKH